MPNQKGKYYIWRSEISPYYCFKGVILRLRVQINLDKCRVKKNTFWICNSCLYSLYHECVAYTECLLLPVSSQVCCTAADTSQSAGPSSGKRDRGEGAGRGNQRAVLRRQVLRQNPPRSTSQVYEIEHFHRTGVLSQFLHTIVHFDTCSMLCFL